MIAKCEITAKIMHCDKKIEKCHQDAVLRSLACAKKLTLEWRVENHAYIRAPMLERPVVAVSSEMLQA